MALDKTLLAGSSATLVLKLLDGRDMYGYQIIEELACRSNNVFQMKAGTLYPLLHGLEKKGLLESYEEHADSARVRKYYRLTQKGKKFLQEKTDEWKEYSSAVSVGIGLFVAFVGLQNAKLIVNSDSTLVTYQHFKGDTFSSVGVGAILALIGVVITAVLLVKKVKGGILYGILITWVLGILCEIAGIYVPNADAGMYSVIPTAFVSFDFSALGKTFGQVFKTDFSGVGILNFFAVMFSFLFVDLFDTLGTLIGVASKADMLDEDGKLPHIKGALLADSIATCAGAVLGTSTTTTFVESASGVTEGGRTGLTAMTTGILFLLATIFSPLFLTIPSFATAPALIIVGFYMMGSAVKIDFNDPSEGIPAFLTILAMPTAYSISEGIAIGVISWTLINLVTGKAKEKKISPLMYVLTVLFILKYVFL